jgi:hypothetical protein
MRSRDDRDRERAKMYKNSIVDFPVRRWGGGGGSGGGGGEGWVGEGILESASVQVCKRNAKIHLYAAARRGNIFFYKETNIRFI